MGCQPILIERYPLTSAPRTMDPVARSGFSGDFAAGAGSSLIAVKTGKVLATGAACRWRKLRVRAHRRRRRGGYVCACAQSRPSRLSRFDPRVASPTSEEQFLPPIARLVEQAVPIGCRAPHSLTPAATTHGCGCAGNALLVEGTAGCRTLTTALGRLASGNEKRHEHNDPRKRQAARIATSRARRRGRGSIVHVHGSFHDPPQAQRIKGVDFRRETCVIIRSLTAASGPGECRWRQHRLVHFWMGCHV